MDWRESRAGKRWLALYGHRKKVRMTWLARARLLSGLSVAQAAKACGLSSRTWEAWERVGAKRREPDVGSITAIYGRFGSIAPDGGPLTPLTARPYCTVSPSTLEVL